MDGSLGLPVENLPGYMPRSSQYPFVAVDFDIFTNKEESIDDPEWEHYLPDLVIAGFSASTATSGVAFTLHKIVSWDFTSTYLDDYETKTNPTSNYNLLLFVALGAGGVLCWLVRLVLFGSSCGSFPITSWLVRRVTLWREKSLEREDLVRFIRAL
ncbi:hypothetical protein FF1_030875 [Malus domestica]